MVIHKHDILTLIQTRLRTDLSILEQAVALARDTATHGDCLGSSKYETMALEASYLAQGQGTRLLEVVRALEYFKRLKPTANTNIGLSSLVLLADEEAKQQLLWLSPEAGGLKVPYHGLEVTVITPRSPLGQALLNHSAGDEIHITIAGKLRSYEIVEIY
ncbi:GreA/GreB family elongation factor [Mariprofundus erugo]|uniref:GreA/GreB family elongation factor n=1 Tax=Mariprofundus erugo TaxID=2528639 RepID=A0A5R9GR62_9PROT|nr:GreA/GreB family elongation factor [Mariprofundus erugo]TLS67555.1 GreA/GreB family elongation factor [Mariprofundus erugo]